MKNESLVTRLLLVNPFKKGMVEWLILIATGVCGLIFSWPSLSFFPTSTILGGVLILLALVFHMVAEKDHRQAHERVENIEIIVKSGVYSKIRHPLYLSLIVLNAGIALAFGGLVTLAIALLTVFHWGAVSWKEEQILTERFQGEYSQYKKNVRWRMIPGIF
ncbi:MAG: isoprenylcysteine carboxylmethyltransferase family protein [Proteobacteria bacterium]|nr:isoprenylcysteine carboxylmethyltransferase family protein [Pseudomonadota bacterium]